MIDNFLKKYNLLTINIGVFLLFALVLSLNYWIALDYPIYFDSVDMLNSPDISTWFSFSSLGDIFTRLRHLVLITFGFNYELLGNHAFGYRLINLIIHVINTWLIYCFFNVTFEAILREKAKRTDAIFAALLFGLNPVAIYSVFYIVQRYMLLVLLFSLLCILFYLKGIQQEHKKNKWFLLLSVFFYFLAIHSKEHVIFLPIILLLLTYLFNKINKLNKNFILVFVGFFAVGLQVVLLSKGVIGRVYEPNAVFGIDALTKQGGSNISNDHLYLFSVLNQCWYYFRYVYLWLVPDYSRMAIDLPLPFINSWFDLRLLAGTSLLGGYVLLSLFLLKCKKDKGLLGFSMLAPVVLFLVEFTTVRMHENFVLYRSYLWIFFLFLNFPLIRIAFGTSPFSLYLKIIVLFVFFGIQVLALQNRLAVFKSPVKVWKDVVSKIDMADKQILTSYRALNNLAMSYGNAGNIDQAIKYYKESIDLNSQFDLSLHGLGTAYYIKKDYKNAIVYLKKSLEYSPNFKPALYRLGMAYLNSGNNELAQKYLMSSNQDQTLNFKVSVDLAREAIAKGDYPKAIKYYRQLQSLDGKDEKILDSLATAYLLNDELEKSLEFSKKAVSIKPEFAEAHYNMAIAYNKLNNSKEAILSFLKCLEYKPNYHQAHYNLANIYFKTKQYDKSIASYQLALKLKPKDFNSMHNLAIVLAQKGSHQQAIEKYNDVIKIRHEFPKVYYNRGNSYYALSEFSLALNDFNSAIKLKSNYYLAWHNAALTLIKLNRSSEAKKYLEKALSIKNDYQPSLKLFKKLQGN
ncbi:hypothetical protein BVY03_03065 [bacterium K02(2017)]|nr:hypothetical protein BVY03_03065 [bacterium K02(2017)]